MTVKQKSKSLTDKQRRYLNCYDGDIKRSAKVAGISYQYARDLHTRTHYLDFQEALKNRTDEIISGLIMTRQERQEFWTSIALGKEEDGIKMSDRIRASELLGKSEADFTENVNHKGKVVTEAVITFVKEKNED